MLDQLGMLYVLLLWDLEEFLNGTNSFIVLGQNCFDVLGWDVGELRREWKDK